MQVQSIRFSDRQWALIQEKARGQGISAGQFVREAAVAHAIVLAVVDNPGSEALWLETLATLREAGGDALEVAGQLVTDRDH